MVMPPEIPERRAGLHRPVRRQDTVVQRHRVGRASVREVGWHERGWRRKVDRIACDPVIGLFETGIDDRRSEEHTSELQSLMRISYAVFCLKKKKKQHNLTTTTTQLPYTSNDNQQTHESTRHHKRIYLQPQE